MLIIYIMERGDYLNQYKLLEVLDCDTLDEIYKIFGVDNIYQFTNTIVAIKYNFDKFTYSDILRCIVGLNLRQWTMTSSRFMDLIEFSVDNYFTVGKIQFLEFIDDKVNKNINENIVKINQSKDIKLKNQLKQRIINDLEWVTLAECIDIQSIPLICEIDEPPFISEVRFFNNGVLYIDNECMLEHLKKFFISYYQRR